MLIVGQLGCRFTNQGQEQLKPFSGRWKARLNYRRRDHQLNEIV